MSDFYLFEAQPCDDFAFEDAVEEFDPNVLPIVGPPGPKGPPGPTGPAGGVSSVDGQTGDAHILPTGGSAGQVLKKRSAEDYDAIWADESGGGGGTTDYDDLTDKPSINGVTLSGNKVTADLKISLSPNSAFAIPAENATGVYDMPGLTAAHEVARWNFSVSAENCPPADLECNTYSGYFTITNKGGTTSETIKPVFEVPTDVLYIQH